MVQVKSFYANNELRNFSYVVSDSESGRAWVIDPFEAGPLAVYVNQNGLKLTAILNTHQHWDHIRGNSALQSLFKSEIPVLEAGDTIALGEGYELRILGTPGHTLDHLAFHWRSSSGSVALFSGDTLFNAGVGNCKNGGNVGLLYNTTMDLLRLPDETVLYPGHDYMKKNLEFALKCEPENSQIKEALKLIESVDTEENLGWTLGMEKGVNPFLRLQSEEIRRNILGKGVAESGQIERDLFVRLRKLRDDW